MFPPDIYISRLYRAQITTRAGLRAIFATAPARFTRMGQKLMNAHVFYFTQNGNTGSPRCVSYIAKITPRASVRSPKRTHRNALCVVLIR